MSNEYKPLEYLPTIDAILSVADLEKVSVKKIRNALQELFEVNLQSHKKEINDIILERYYSFLDASSKVVKPSKTSYEQLKKENALLAARLSKAKAKPRAKKVRQKVSDSPAKERKSGFFQEKGVSEQLQTIIGVDKCSRPQIVKQLWAYIKDHNLQNPEDKREIKCDDKLQALFHKDTVGAFEMNKLLSQHIFSLEETNTPETSQADETSQANETN